MQYSIPEINNGVAKVQFTDGSWTFVELTSDMTEADLDDRPSHHATTLEDRRDTLVSCLPVRPARLQRSQQQSMSTHVLNMYRTALRLTELSKARLSTSQRTGWMRGRRRSPKSKPTTRSLANGHGCETRSTRA